MARLLCAKLFKKANYSDDFQKNDVSLSNQQFRMKRMRHLWWIIVLLSLRLAPAADTVASFAQVALAACTVVHLSEDAARGHAGSHHGTFCIIRQGADFAFESRLADGG